MNKEFSPEIRPFDCLEVYEQKEPGEAHFKHVLKKDEIDSLSIGYVNLIGPIHKTVASHDDWDQVYFIFSGKAEIQLNDYVKEVMSPSAVIIPSGTEHSVRVNDGCSVEYIYINKWH